ncbi:MAG: hypothetical protein ACYDIA_00135 [Candidatus Humimicrobiaceae bacterium]
MAQAKLMDNFDYFKEEQKKLEGLAEIYRGESEKQLTSLSKNLILVATIFIALSSSIIGSTIIKEIAPSLKLIFLSSLGLLVLSIFFGFIHFIIDVGFYRGWVSVISGIYKNIAIGTFKKIEDYKQALSDKVNKLKLSSVIWSLILQGLLLFLGVLVFVFFIYRFLI